MVHGGDSGPGREPGRERCDRPGWVGSGGHQLEAHEERDEKRAGQPLAGLAGGPLATRGAPDERHRLGDQGPHQVGPEHPAHECQEVQESGGGDALDLKLVDDVAPRRDRVWEADPEDEAQRDPGDKDEQAEAGPQQPAEAGETAEKQSHGAVPSSAWAVAVPVTETVLMSTRLSRYG